MSGNWPLSQDILRHQYTITNEVFNLYLNAAPYAQQAPSDSAIDMTDASESNFSDRGNAGLRLDAMRAF
jgi:hypothetical protein